jgi:hypothetical protein
MSFFLRMSSTPEANRMACGCAPVAAGPVLATLLTAQLAALLFPAEDLVEAVVFFSDSHLRRSELALRLVAKHFLCGDSYHGIEEAGKVKSETLRYMEPQIIEDGIYWWRLV